MSIFDKFFGRTPKPDAIPRDAVSIPAEYPGLNAKYAGDDVMSARFPIMKLLKGFLLFDQSMYQTNLDPRGLNASVDFLAATHNRLGTLTGKHLSNRENLEIVDYCEAFHEETGGYLSYLEYRVSQKDQFDRAVKFDWSSLTMGRINLKDADKGGLLTLMFGMTGFNTTPPGEHQIHIVPVDVLCRSGHDTFLAPTDALSLSSGMAYANQAFIQLAGGMEFDPVSNQTLFDEQRLGDADTICRHLEERTMTSLDAEILKYRGKIGLAPQ
ncbi:MAG: hypothetical protein PHX61_01465 [Alphaproteobacteria bacterium]|nr:hypothetical protein [Alphaproteobacteria bacterium]